MYKCPNWVEEDLNIEVSDDEILDDEAENDEALMEDEMLVDVPVRKVKASKQKKPSQLPNALQDITGELMETAKPICALQTKLNNILSFLNGLLE